MAQMSDVYEAMRGVSQEALRTALLAKKEKDPAAGIYIAQLPAPSIEVDGQQYHIYGARVERHVNPHHHLKGDEPYLFVEGMGEMNIGHIEGDGGICWEEPSILHPGEIWTIAESEVHTLRNLGERPVDFLFACPPSHLQDHSREHPEGDRYMANRLPPHYEK